MDKLREGLIAAVEKLAHARAFLAGYRESDPCKRNAFQGTVDQWISGLDDLYDLYDEARAALAEPVADEPVARACQYNGGTCKRRSCAHECTAMALRDTRPAPAPAERGESATIMALVEDYAKAVHDGDDNSCTVLQRTIHASIEQLCVDADRAQRVPLTDERIKQISKWYGTRLEFARAIERAHKIGAKP